MAFRFALAAVLRFRESIEQQEYLALERIQQEIAQAERRMLKCDERIAAATKRREAELARGVASIHLQSAYEETFALQKQREALQAMLQELQAKRQEQIKSYEVARQKREVLDELRTRQLDAYRREQATRQQKMLDDIFLSRRKRSY
jgi:flagellar export protein FliJ